ncbi:MAG: glycosyltransferase [Planctomycetota bacterium]|jgi:glycosyltransferase involved in cell wall biosynthesis/peptidoglycan/xylan/chitin deacetylase (PgdA/CDA1 family)
MRILHLIAGLEPGGAERQVVTLALFQQQEHTVQVCLLGGGGALAEELSVAGIQVHHLKKRKGMDWTAVQALGRLLREQQIEVLHCHIWTANLWGRFAALRARTPVVIIHEHSLFTAQSWTRRVVSRLLQPITDTVIAVSEEIHRELRTRCGVPEDACALVRNGIDLEPLSASAEDRDRRVGACAFGEHLTAPPRIVIVGALEPRKDHETFLAAAAWLLAQGHEAEFVVAGDGPLREALEEQTRALGIEEAVHFIGVVTDIPALLAEATLYVSSSRTEGISLALLEAMAVGVPVVATAVGGNAEVLRGGRAGMLVPPGKAEALANAMESLLTCTGVGETFSHRARALVHRRFSAPAMSRSILRLYEHRSMVAARPWPSRAGACIKQVARWSLSRLSTPRLLGRRLRLPPQELRILTYHRVRDGVLTDRLSVSSDSLARQVLCLQEAGIPLLTVSEGLRRLGEGDLPNGGVALTFDDGYVDCIAGAFDVLASAGVVATVYLPAGLMDQGGMVERYQGQPEAGRLLTWEEAGRLVEAGWEVGSHTLSHALLPACTASDCIREVAQSRQLIQERLGTAPASFCYPDGRLSAAVVETVRQAGYESAVTVWAGGNRADGRPWLLNRTEISGGDGLSDFRWKVMGGFDRWHRFRQRGGERCPEGLA